MGTKRQKMSTSEQTMPLIDRLSGLADSVLCRILSFLPTKVAVATSILGRRWRLLWTGVSKLRLMFNTKSKHKDRIPDIINRVMMLHNAQNLSNFRLYCTEYCCDYQLETWMAAAVARKVRKIDLYFPRQVILPPCLFTCKTLVDMKLQVCGPIPFPVAVCLPSLKKLHLYLVQYKNDENLPHLISGCPVLEKFVINRIAPQDLVFCKISSPTIKRLTVKFRFQLYGIESRRHDYRVEIDAPRLTYLRVEDSLSEHISAQMLTSLTKADIRLKNKNVKADDVVYSDTVLAFVDELYNVDWLKLSIGYTKFLDSGFSASTVRFQNLTKLELAADWRFLTKFLQYADNLKSLIIREFHLNEWVNLVVDKDLRCWLEPEQVPTCLLSHLTTIEVDGFRHEENEFEMVRYLLKNARVLKRMEITSSLYILSDKYRALQRISLFQRGSEACELAFG